MLYRIINKGKGLLQITKDNLEKIYSDRTSGYINDGATGVDRYAEFQELDTRLALENKTQIIDYTNFAGFNLQVNDTGTGVEFVKPVFEGTYSELKTLADTNKLLIGQTYILKDYQTVYEINESNSSPVLYKSEVIGVISGFGRFSPTAPELQNGSEVIIDYLPVGYSGTIQVGDVTTVTEYFSEEFFKLVNGGHNVVGLGIKYTLNKFKVKTELNGVTLSDINGKPIIKPNGVLNTEVHDGTPYIEMTASENKAVPFEDISLLAISTNQFSKQAKSLTFVGDILEYDFNDSEVISETGVKIADRKGFITRRVNNTLNVDVDKDWRVQRYRRYKIDEVESWNNFLLNNSVNHTLYDMNTINSCTTSNENITESHKFILPKIESEDFYFDFTKNGIEPNVFSTGQATAPDLSTDQRRQVEPLNEFIFDIVVNQVLAKDIFIFDVDDNLNPIDLKEFRIEKLINTIFTPLPNQFGGSVLLNINAKEIENSSFKCYCGINSSNELKNIITLDDCLLTNTGSITFLNVLSYTSLNNRGEIFRTTLGGYPSSTRNIGVTASYILVDNNSLLWGCIFGGKRVEGLKISSSYINKGLLTFDVLTAVTLESSTLYLTAYKNPQMIYNSSFKLDVGGIKNIKKDVFGVIYNSMMNKPNRSYFTNSTEDILYQEIDGLNNNQIQLMTHSISE